MSADLILRGGRVIDPANQRDAVGDVFVTNGAVSADPAPGATEINATGCIVTPGLIDLHTHVYWGGTSLGVDPATYAAKSATPTLVDAGSAGPGNFAGFAAHVIAPAVPRVLAYLHVSFAGIYAFASRVMVGESHDMRLMAAREAAEVARAHPGLIVGIKVRLGAHASGDSRAAPLDVALDVADATGLPLMVHIDEPPPTYGAVVSRLRKGDVLTHCFRPFPNAPMNGQGKVRPEVLEARERGVLFDIGHGMGSFSWRSARAMLAEGFRPDVISSDIHALCLDGPAHDLPHVMTKFLALGLPLADIVAMTTTAPASALSRTDLGHLTPGAPGDVSVLRLTPGNVTLTDVEGETVIHGERLAAVGYARDGVWHDSPQATP
ncbi:amidohydrolase/deacetylase family metallohydrolase [Flavimaricola marinus]|uniref:Formyltransferase/hydrolase complex Fhc subunit A n=1 Tax=Flavimaricola marinus TaxID=1819565 RepID=A0A238LIF1_9RHOB|nr:amidohydrolase/deacetylase family metallohydrolase [Flavimaricola marinus]SMY09421.1 Formyltransferase/hydrolase complex Fhc subunit A [Flavimaricola marinus]